jgi:hypothetical protein
MDDPLMKATLYYEQPERMRALGLREADRKRREAILGIAEYYYLLHDQYVELAQLFREGIGSMAPTSAAERAKPG